MAVRPLAIAGLLAAIAGSLTPASAQQGAAEAPPPFPDFTFRRVPVPDPTHSGPRITVQIGDGTGSTEETAAAPEPAPAPPSAAENAWFWDLVPPSGDPDARRYHAVMQALATAPEAASLPVMRADALLELAQAHGGSLLTQTVGTQVSPALALAVMAVESRGDAAAESPAGAQGLMQLIPATAARFGVEEPFDAHQNISGGVAYLDWLMEEFARDPVLVLAAYNAGEGAVRQAGGVPDFRETRDYVPRVLATWAAARLLCITPPELVSDGCVFRTMVATDG